MKNLRITVNGTSYDVQVEELAEGAVPAATAPAPKKAPAKKVSAPAPAKAGSGEPVKAPMPGVILDIKVSQGQSVKKGDCVFILEAMKMENDVVAPADGTVKQILVEKGASVDTGAVLAVI